MSPFAALVIAVLALSVVCTFLGYAMICATNRIFWLQEDLQQATDTSHAKCMSAVMAFVGDEFAAQVLRVAADDWDSVEEQAVLRTLANERYVVGGPSMPAIWLRDRADRLVESHEDVAADA